jgi:valyl-tRNA synthetase
MIWNTTETQSIYIEFGEHVKELLGEVRRKKTEQQMSMKDEMPELIITCPKKFREFYKQTELDIKACTSANKILFRS